MTINIEHSLDAGDTPREKAPRAGRRLAGLRLDRGLSLEDVAAETRVSLANLQAIEAENYEKLPSDTFTCGLIVLYAKVLGEDGRALARQFFLERDRSQQNSPGGGKRPRYHCRPQKLAEPAHVSSAAVAASMLSLIVLSFVVCSWCFSWHPFAFLRHFEKNAPVQAGAMFHPADPSTRQIGTEQPIGLKTRSDPRPEFVLHLGQWPRAEPYWPSARLRPIDSLLTRYGGYEAPDIQRRTTVSSPVSHFSERLDNAVP